MISVSENVVLESEWLITNIGSYKICPYPSTRYLYVRWPFFYYETHRLRVRNSCVEGREVKCFNAITGGDEPRLQVL